MSADFLTDSQVQNYGRYAAEPNDVQLARYFHLDERDRDFVNQRRGRHNRLGIALQLTTARFLGTFINDAMQIPDGVRHYVAAQMGIPRPEILSRYVDHLKICFLFSFYSPENLIEIMAYLFRRK